SCSSDLPRRGSAPGWRHPGPPDRLPVSLFAVATVPRGTVCGYRQLFPLAALDGQHPSAPPLLAPEAHALARESDARRQGLVALSPWPGAEPPRKRDRLRDRQCEARSGRTPVLPAWLPAPRASAR